MLTKRISIRQSSAFTFSVLICIATYLRCCGHTTFVAAFPPHHTGNSLGGFYYFAEVFVCAVHFSAFGVQ